MGEIKEVENLAAVLGFKVGAHSTKYLGLPLGVAHKPQAICYPVIDQETTSQMEEKVFT